MECLIGVKFRDYVLLAADASSLHSILVQKDDVDKMHNLSSNLVMGVVGEAGDTDQFAEYIEKNLKLYKMRNGYELTPPAAAHFTRNTLATHLRSRNPYFVNLLMGGYDKETDRPVLYYMDYLAASVEVPYVAFGYAGYFSLSILDRFHKPDMTEKEGHELLRLCVAEIKRRFLLNLNKFKVRCVSKDGIKEMPDIITAEADKK